MSSPAKIRLPADYRRTRAFPDALALLLEQYEIEIAHLGDEYRERIQAGEFSGEEPNGRGWKFCRLEDELARTHPWARNQRSARAVLAVSPWGYGPKSDVELASARTTRHSAGTCLAHDVLRLARKRGWKRRR